MNNVPRWMLCFAVGVGCVEQPAPAVNRGVSAQELDAIRHRVVTRTAPTPQHPLAFTFGGGKIQLLGYDVNQTELRPGQSVTVTWYWKCNNPTGDGWHLFTHLDDANAPRTNEDNVGDVRRAYQPDHWRAGEYIRDTQTFELPTDWDSPVVKINLGLWKDNERMDVAGGDSDGQKRARAIVMPTGVQLQVAQITLPRASGPVTLDGRLDDPAWAMAARTGPLVNTATGMTAGPTDAHATARMMWDDTNLYVAFEVQDENLIDPSTARDNHLWEHDAVEVMIDPSGTASHYYELQVSPKNQHFDTFYDHPRDPQPVGHADWNPNWVSAAVVNGTIGNPDDTDTGWITEIAIPWVSIAQGMPHVPPQAGDQIRLNLFVMDEPKTGGQRVAGWSAPRRGDFHTLERFGRVTLSGTTGASPVGLVIPGHPGVPPTAMAHVPTVGIPAPVVPAPPPAPAPAPATAGGRHGH